MADAELTIALAGNPNCGKTTIFNNITGARQHVGNYPGVTVERREGFRQFQNKNLLVVDLPGTYSLTAHALDEVVARNAVINEQPDVIVNILDASNLERNLYLAVQLLELERPVVLALNMADMAKQMGVEPDERSLSEILKLPVVSMVGSQNKGTEALLETVLNTAATDQKSTFVLDYGPAIETKIAAFMPLLATADPRYPKRWLAIKLLENDSEVVQLAAGLAQGAEIAAQANAARAELQDILGEEADIAIAEQRYRYVGEIYRQAVVFRAEHPQTLSDKIDNVLVNRLWGLPIFFGIMWLLFNFVFTLGQYPQGWMEDGVQWLSDFLGQYLADGDLKSLLIDGVIGGVGGVLTFLPQILLLFLGIAVMEDSGYMARAAFVMDRIMRAVGLHGKSFIPLLLGFGCNVPAIMGTRTLENPRDRLVTILIAPLISCSARLPIYLLLAGAFFAPDIVGTVMFSIYLLGIIMAVVMALIFRKFLFPGAIEPFVMEMPPYHLPTLRSLAVHMWERSALYLKKAGTLILAASILVWFLTSYPREIPNNPDAGQQVTQEQEASAALSRSYAGQLGQWMEPVLRPLGFDWKIGIGLFTAVAAKETLVSTMGTIYSIGDVDDDTATLRDTLAADPTFSPLVAYALMVFTLLYSPCTATLAVIRRETNSWKWMFFSFAYSTALAWVCAFVVYQGGVLLGL